MKTSVSAGLNPAPIPGPWPEQLVPPAMPAAPAIGAVSFRPTLYHRLAPLYAVALIAANLVVLVSTGGFLTLQFSLLFVAVAGVILFVTELLGSRYVVVLCDVGIYGHTVWGRRVALSWSEISAVRLHGLVGFSFLRIAGGAESPVMWVPLDLKKSQAFACYIVEHTPSEHPLRRHFDV